MTGSVYAIECSQRLEAPAADIFAAWTMPEKIQTWLAPGAMVVDSVELDLRVGGRFSIQVIDPQDNPYTACGVYREISPARMLSCSWQWTDSNYDTVLHMHLAGGDQNATDLTLHQSGFPDSRARERNEQYWSGCLMKLKDLFFVNTVEYTLSHE